VPSNNSIVVISAVPTWAGVSGLSSFKLTLGINSKCQYFTSITTATMTTIEFEGTHFSYSFSAEGSGFD